MPSLNRLLILTTSGATSLLLSMAAFSSPPSLSPTLESAKAIFLSQGPSQALLKLPENRQASLEERFFRAFLILETKNYALAGQEFSSLAKSYPLLSDRSYFLAASAWEKANNLLKAETNYRSVSKFSVQYVDARRKLASVLQSQGKNKAALTVLQPLYSKHKNTPSCSLLLEIALLQEKLGQKTKAAHLYLKIWSQYPLCGSGSNSNNILNHARRLGIKPLMKHHISRAEKFLEAHHSKETVKILRPILKSPDSLKDLSPELRCRAQFALGKSFRNLRKHSQALPMLNLAMHSCKTNQAIWTKAIYVAAVSASIIQPEKAMELYKTLAQKKPDHSFADDALFAQAELHLRQDKIVEAQSVLESLVKKYPRGDFHDEALFKLFWIARSQKKWKNAISYLDSLIKKSHSSADRALYWKAKTLATDGQPQESIQQYQTLIKLYPYSFYSSMARATLTQSRPQLLKVLNVGLPPSAADNRTYSLGSLRSNHHWKAAQVLFALGLDKWGAEELMAINRSALKAEKESLFVFLNLLQKSSQAPLGYSLARQAFSEELAKPAQPETLPFWKLSYPLAFRDSVVTHSKVAGIDSELLQALIREESALQPTIRSWAGAVGLCQLMPSTANQVARWLKLPSPMPSAKLLDPHTNLQLGAHYLARLLKKWNGSLPLALASYNAGSRAVQRWLTNFQGNSLDEFVEEIPIDETRNYVKRVLKSWATYRLLYGLTLPTNLGPFPSKAASLD